MLRSGSPDLVRQELAAWPAGTEMTRGVARAAALAAAPARKGRRAGKPVQAREISHARTRHAVIAATRAGRTSYTALPRQLPHNPRHHNHRRHWRTRQADPNQKALRPRIHAMTRAATGRAGLSFSPYGPARSRAGF